MFDSHPITRQYSGRWQATIHTILILISTVAFDLKLLKSLSQAHFFH